MTVSLKREYCIVLSATYSRFLPSEVTFGLEMCEYTLTEGESQDVCASLNGSLQRPVDVYPSIGPSGKT